MSTPQPSLRRATFGTSKLRRYLHFPLVAFAILWCAGEKGCGSSFFCLADELQDAPVEVVAKLPFAVDHAFVTRDPTARPDVVDKTLYRTEDAGDVYSIGSTYRFAPIKIEKGGIQGNKPNSDSPITYSVVNAPPGFLVDPDDGYMQGIPTTEGKFNTSIYAINGEGTRSLEPIQRIYFDVRVGVQFVLATVDRTTRRASGPRYTNPTTTTTYFVDENYMIAPLQLDEPNTKGSDGGNSSTLKYTLEGAPHMWFVQASTGTITGQFGRAGNFRFRLVAADRSNQKQVVETFTFAVVPKENFKVINFSRQPSPSRKYNIADYTDPTTTATYAVGHIPL